MSLEEAIEYVVMHTKRAENIRLDYENALLRYKNFQRDFLPSVTVKVSPFRFNRSIERLQNAADGSYAYAEDYNGSSSTGISIRQNIVATGGYVEMGSSFNFLREFSSNRNSFNTRPFYISLSQPLWGGRNSYLLAKDVERLNRAVASKSLIKLLVDCQKETAMRYLQAYVAQQNLNYTERMLLASDSLLAQAKEKSQYGRITLYEYKQVELQQAEYAYWVVASRSAYKECMQQLYNYMECTDEIQLSDLNIKPHPAIASNQRARITGVYRWR